MGYNTYFEGKFALNKKLTIGHYNYLVKFSKTRRMKRDTEKAELLKDDDRKSIGLEIGEDAGYFVGGIGFHGQGQDESILDYNNPPKDQPGLWCHWTPSLDKKFIQWNEGEKFYNYVEWLEYLIEHFLKKWGYVLNGIVSYEGEDSDDKGMIVVKDNEITVN